jgi:hypothetical protein
MASGRDPQPARNADSARTVSTSRGGGRAFGLGPRRGVRPIAVLGSVALLAVLCGILVSSRHGATVTSIRHSVAAARSTDVAPAVVSTLHSVSTAKYGGLPAWLPKANIAVGRVLHASRAHPVLSVQGEAVSVQLTSGRVLATAAGPSVPEEGQTPVAATSPCTFVVTFAAASGAIPLDPNTFTLIDEFGHVRHPQVTAMDGGAPPARVLPGRTVSLMLHDVLPTGDGGLTWAPDGGRPIVAWDFTVEID